MKKKEKLREIEYLSSTLIKFDGKCLPVKLGSGNSGRAPDSTYCFLPDNWYTAWDLTTYHMVDDDCLHGGGVAMSQY